MLERWHWRVRIGRGLSSGCIARGLPCQWRLQHPLLPFQEALHRLFSLIFPSAIITESGTVLAKVAENLRMISFVPGQPRRGRSLELPDLVQEAGGRGHHRRHRFSPTMETGGGGTLTPRGALQELLMVLLIHNYHLVLVMVRNVLVGRWMMVELLLLLLLMQFSRRWCWEIPGHLFTG